MLLCGNVTRIAVLSDIHGNLLALEAVMADVRDQAPDAVVNLGDHLSGPLQARDTADLLMTCTDWIQIRGNHDRQLVECVPGTMGLSDAAAYAQLGTRHLEWLRSLPATVLTGELELVHGTPHSDLEYLLEKIADGRLQLAPSAQIAGRIQGTTGAVVCCGHSHVPRWVHPEGRFVLNPGSVGLQAYNDSDHDVENGSPHARYAVVEHRLGAWQVSFRVVAYRHELAAALAERQGRRDWQHALLTGYAHT